MTPEQIKYQSEILANRVRKNFAHLAKRYAKQNIDCFRLFDWDIPEVRAVVDWYAGHLVVGEYVHLQTGPEWLPQMAEAVAEALGVPSYRTHVKRRQTKTEEGPRYSKLASTGERMKVRERDLQFWVNLDDFLDTGLFSDHRDTRVLIGKLAKEKDFLNLYGYTGTFTCAAALGGVKSSVTVDRSATYLKWAEDNLQLNGLLTPQHEMVQSDVTMYLRQAVRYGRRFTLALIDPPSFYKNHDAGVSFDINRDHPELIRQVLKIMAPGSLVFFSTNHQRFEPKLEGLSIKDLVELTPKSIPEDYRNRQVHRCWKMTAL
ncbi:MAG: class I SAM-dependent methyltransferase [Candidatus Omnitrophica bacterium]|nr:class I SAM-dependent methyltransferase [Candidatus Omnitrophota bacterium]